MLRMRLLTLAAIVLWAAAPSGRTEAAGPPLCAATDLTAGALSCGQTSRASVATGGEQADGADSYATGMSADGRYVAFSSLAANLVAGDTNGAFDAFVRDTATGQTTRVSVATGGNQANANSFAGPISADGRFVLIYSHATNLVAGDTNDIEDVFFRDTVTGQTTRVSIGTNGEQANGSPYIYRGPIEASMSADGRYIAFFSDATNLVAGDTNNRFDAFMRDTATGQTTRVSLGLAGAQANDDSYPGPISADGRYIVIYSDATNLVAGDTNGTADVFRRDTATGLNTLVSVASDGTQTNNYSSQYGAAMSADGRYVAFNSYATNLVAGDTNGDIDVYLRDTSAGVTRRVSVGTGGTEADTGGYGPSLSADGRYVAFTSRSALVASDTNRGDDVFVRDTATGQTARASLGPAGIEASGGSVAVALSADGRHVAFTSPASNLVAGDTNGRSDAFVRDQRPTSLGL